MNKNLALIFMIISLLKLFADTQNQDYGKLFIIVNPKDAHISIDGIVENTFEDIYLEPGTYTISIKKDNYYEILESIKINKNDDIRKVFEMQAFIAKVKVITPADSTKLEVLKDTTIVYSKLAKEQVIKLPEGDYIMRFSYKQKVYNLRVKLNSKNNEDILINMEDSLKTGLINVKVKPEDAVIEVIGEYNNYNLNNNESQFISYGQNTLRISKYNYLTTHLKINIDKPLNAYNIRLKRDYRDSYSLFRIKIQNKLSKIQTYAMYEKLDNQDFISIPLLMQTQEDDVFIGVLSDLKLNIKSSYAILNLFNIGLMKSMINNRDFQANIGVIANLGVQTPYNKNGYKLCIRRFHDDDENDQNDYFYQSGALFNGGLKFELNTNLRLGCLHLLTKAGYCAFLSEANNAQWYKENNLIEHLNLSKDVIKDSHYYLSVGLAF